LRDIFNPNGPFYIYGEQLFNIMVVSLFWAICCIPIVTIIPATSALYYVVVKQIRKNNGSLLNNYFGSFRDNLRIGIPLTSIVLVYATVVIAAIWALNGNVEIGSLGRAGNYLSYAAKAMLLPLLLVIPYLAPVLSRFTVGIKTILQLSIVMAVRFFWRTVLLLVLITASALLLWFAPQVSIVLPALCILICSFLIEPVLRHYMPEHDPNEPTPWYWE
jgi:uncharacterized membrane protein YesL